jgi:L-malate glycosyltransferase
MTGSRVDRSLKTIPARTVPPLYMESGTPRTSQVDAAGAFTGCQARISWSRGSRMTGTPKSVVLLAAANDVHTQRWAAGLAERDIAVTLVTQHAATAWRVPSGIDLRVLPTSGKIGYFANALPLRRLLRDVRPDILNAHYASGYGTTAALVGYRPTLLSVWGSDVYDFPDESWLTGRLIRWNIRRAHAVGSTSEVMAKQVRKLVPTINDVAITPFGVDTDQFRPRPDLRDTTALTIGTVRKLARKYGIDVLIRAFARLRSDPQLAASGVADRLRLLIVGEGPERPSLEELAADLGVQQRTQFVGNVPHREVPEWLNRMDIFGATSRLDSESFGVAVIEASSCALPVVVSDVGGLPEVVDDKLTGLVVPREDVEATFRALKTLVEDPDLRDRMGTAGHERVRQRYEWSRCVDMMIEWYSSATRGARQR